MSGAPMTYPSIIIPGMWAHYLGTHDPSLIWMLSFGCLVFWTCLIISYISFGSGPRFLGGPDVYINFICLLSFETLIYNGDGMHTCFDIYTGLMNVITD